METRRGMETRLTTKGGKRRGRRKSARKREKARGGGGSPGRRETCRGRNEFEKGLSALFRVVSIAAAYRSDGIIAAGSSDLKFSHLCCESTVVHISSRGACTAPLRRRRAAAPGTRAVYATFALSRERTSTFLRVARFVVITPVERCHSCTAMCRGNAEPFKNPIKKESEIMTNRYTPFRFTINFTISYFEYGKHLNPYCGLLIFISTYIFIRYSEHDFTRYQQFPISQIDFYYKN